MSTEEVVAQLNAVGGAQHATLVSSNALRYVSRHLPPATLSLTLSSLASSVVIV
jgi:hypothetical protein